MRAGEISQSARSITSRDLERLYDINHSFPVYRLGEAPLGPNGEKNWGGGRLRLMLQCIYTIAFLCLLRFDEVLKIQAHHLEVIDEGLGEIKLTLPFRKTHKHGGLSQVDVNNAEIKPFHLFHNIKDRHLDPTHAILCWIRQCRIREGYIFRRISADDRVTSENKPLVCPHCRR